jgi:hypothetical protein
MTGTIEHPNRTGASAASEWAEASCVSLRSQTQVGSALRATAGLAQPGASLVKAEDIITPEELAAHSFSLRSPTGSRNRGSRCPTHGSTKRPAAAAAIYQVPLRLLRGAQPGRFHACGSGAMCDYSDRSLTSVSATRSLVSRRPWGHSTRGRTIRQVD